MVSSEDDQVRCFRPYVPIRSNVKLNLEDKSKTIEAHD